MIIRRGDHIVMSTIFKVINVKPKNNFKKSSLNTNVGSNNNNFRKLMLKRIKKFIPGFKSDIVKSSKDPRDYRVNFNKLYRIQIQVICFY